VQKDSHAVVLELCCGTAGLSASFKRLGFDTIAVDKHVPKAPKASITKLDLTQFSTQQLVLEWIRMPQVKAVFIAPPCGTASKARTIHLDDVENLPQPLRTVEQPDGVDNLEGLDFLRVSQSNVLYDFVSACYEECCALDKLFLCENPRDSLFWLVSPWAERQYQNLAVEQVHQACAYGSLRPKWTKLSGNFSEISEINQTCPGDHKHEPWGMQRINGRKVFATALEVHYPMQLCDAIANTVALALSKRNIVPKPELSMNQTARAFSDVQQGTTKIPTFIPEFRTKIAGVWFQQMQIWPLKPFDDNASKLLYEISVGADDIQQLGVKLTEQCNLKCIDVCFDNLDLSRINVFPCAVQLKIFGVYFSEEELLSKAMRAQHPLAAELALPQELREAILFNFNAADHEVVKHRASFLAKWVSRAKELSSEECNLKKSMDPNVASAVRNKRILVFKEMLIDTGFPDLGVVDELINGASLTGEVPSTGMLPGKFTPAVATDAEIREAAARIRPKLDSDNLGSGDPTIDAEVWRKTLEEVDKGWLQGPLPRSSVPGDQPISRRFGLLQKQGKVRLIDDFSESGVSSTVTSVESPVLHTIDVACAVLAFWFGLCNEGGADPKLVVRTFDLTSAYRQVGLCQAGREFACIRVFDPKDKCMKYFRCCVLPFGAIRSVHTFLRLARAIWWIGTVGCKLMWTSFYDDFITCSKPVLSSCAESTVISLFRLLGWAFAEDGDKCQPFPDSCEALGVAVNLSDSGKGRATICNTEARIQELFADLQAVLDEGVLKSKVAQRLRGRKQFAESQLFGCTGRRCLKVLSDFAESKKLKMQPKDRFFISLFKELLQNNIPREVCALGNCNVVVFTDACYERDSLVWPCGLGGVLCEGNERLYFSLEVVEHIRHSLGELVKKQIIFEAETLSAVVAFVLWKRRFVNKRCILFVDNEGSKFSPQRVF
jgi:hypothetical protein